MSLTVASVEQQEAESILPGFDSDVAWELGNNIRTALLKHTRPAVVSIMHVNSSQQLFFATSGPGTLPDNAIWVKRKEAVVLRWGISTMLMRLKLAERNRTLQMAYEMADPSVYAVHGGGFPVKVKGVEGIVGVIVVSGLTQEDDHAVIVQGIKQYLAQH